MATKAKSAKKSTTKKTVKKVHSSKSSKKLNKKGIGQHLLLIIVAVVAVTGAVGFFVWQRQNNNEIDAKAAGIPAIAAGNTTAPQYIRMFACKSSPQGGKGFNISFAGTRKPGKGVTAFKIMRGNSTWGNFEFPATLPPGPDINTIYPGGGPGKKPMTNVLPTEKITISYTDSYGGYPYGTYTTAKIANCPLPL